MTPEQKLKHAVINLAAQFAKKAPPEINETNVDSFYSDIEEVFPDYWDAKEEIRTSGVETDIPCEASRNYESQSVAYQTPDGSWVGYTYWSGGGKFGQPESVKWMNQAYNLSCQEEEKLVIVRTFSR